MASDILCGKVYRASNSTFFIQCNLCAKSYEQLKYFTVHYNEHDIKNVSMLNEGISQIFKEEPAVQDSISQSDKDSIHSVSVKIDDIGICSDFSNHSNSNICVDIKELNESESTIDSNVKLKTHNKTNEGKSKLKQKKCLRSRKISKISSEKWTCNICNEEIISTPRQKQKHIQKHRDNSFKCILKSCREYFATENELSKHNLEYHSENPNLPFKCPICFKLFGLKEKLKIHHKRVHLNEKNFKCNFCDKSFFENADRTIHERTHTKETFCVCEVCGKGFATTSSLRAHRERKHSKELNLEMREYKCKTCEKVFHRKDYLNSHVVIHSKERKFVCNICCLSFSWSSGLRRHMNVHNETRDFVCKLCGKDFTSKIRITCHMKSHGLPYISANVYRKSLIAEKQS